MRACVRAVTYVSGDVDTAPKQDEILYDKQKIHTKNNNIMSCRSKISISDKKQTSNTSCVINIIIIIIITLLYRKLSNSKKITLRRITRRRKQIGNHFIRKTDIK